MLNKNKKTLTYALYLGSAALFSLANSAYATDSARLQWDTNGHYYQLFEGSPITWSNAKTACESRSAHLATITSEAEQGFIYSQLVAGRNFYNYYHIGGVAADTYTWAWTTGEAWGYVKWGGGAPQHDNGRNYLALTVKYNPWGTRR